MDARAVGAGAQEDQREATLLAGLPAIESKPRSDRALERIRQKVLGERPIGQLTPD